MSTSNNNLLNVRLYTRILVHDKYFSYVVHNTDAYPTIVRTIIMIYLCHDKELVREIDIIAAFVGYVLKKKCKFNRYARTRLVSFFQVKH